MRHRIPSIDGSHAGGDESAIVVADPLSTSDRPTPGRLQSILLENKAVRKVLPGYIAELPRNVAEMSAFLASRRLNELRRIVHQMRGSGGGYGFPDITRLATTAEASIDAHTEIEKIEAAVQELCTLVRSIDGYEPAKETHHAASRT